MALVLVKKNPTFDHIIDNLYLGDINAVDETIISKENIKIIVNISNSRYNELNGIEYYHIDIDDNRNINIYDKLNHMSITNIDIDDTSYLLTSSVDNLSINIMH